MILSKSTGIISGGNDLDLKAGVVKSFVESVNRLIISSLEYVHT
jgi:hypothetical protein